MRTTVTLPDDLLLEARPFVEGRSLSQFIREAIRGHVERLRHEKLARDMSEGYRHEAESPSLDPAWDAVETEGWA